MKVLIGVKGKDVNEPYPEEEEGMNQAGDATKFIKETMGVSPNSNCKRCYGRGYVATHAKTHAPAWCECVLKKIRAGNKGRFDMRFLVKQLGGEIHGLSPLPFPPINREALKEDHLKQMEESRKEGGRGDGMPKL